MPSMIRQELEHQLLNLSPADKAQIIESFTKTLRTGGRGISKTPGICGGEACIAGTRITVWLLEAGGRRQKAREEVGGRR